MKKAIGLTSLTLALSYWAQAQSTPSIVCENQDFHVKVVVSDVQPFSASGSDAMVDLTGGIVTINRDGRTEDSFRTIGPRSSSFESFRNDKGYGIDIKTDENGQLTAEMKSKTLNLKKLECTDHRDPALVALSKPGLPQKANSSKGAR